MTKNNEYCANKDGVEAKIQVGHSKSQEPHKAIVAELKRRFQKAVEFVFDKTRKNGFYIFLCDKIHHFHFLQRCT